MSVSKFLSKEEEALILDAIKTSEKNTSGEIRLHLESICKKEDPMKRGLELFKQLKMHRTKFRNGVLFYVAVESHHFAIIGDKGIHQKVPANFWNETKNLVLNHFKKGDQATGLAQGILKAGEQLKSYFPYQKDDQNELSDEISTGS